MEDMGHGDASEPEPESGAARAVLVSGTSAAEHETACTDLLEPSGADVVDVLFVSFLGVPRDRLETLRGRPVTVDRTAMITVGESGDAGFDPDRTVSLASVAAVDHLSELGSSVRDVLHDWAEKDATSVLCFDSVTALLERADLELTFEFLLVLIEGIRPTGTISHFHIDADAHDTTTLRTLEHVFDEVLELDGKG